MAWQDTGANVACMPRCICACVHACICKFVRAPGALTYSLVGIKVVTEPQREKRSVGKESWWRDAGCRMRWEKKREREGREWERRGLMHQPQPGWLAARGNCRAMFIATQFVKPTLNGNNVPLSVSFLSLPRLSFPPLPPPLSLFLTLCYGNRSFHVRNDRAPYMRPASAATSKFGCLETLSGGCFSRGSALCFHDKLKGLIGWNSKSARMRGMFCLRVLYESKMSLHFISDFISRRKEASVNQLHLILFTQLYKSKTR